MGFARALSLSACSSNVKILYLEITNTASPHSPGTLAIRLTVSGETGRVLDTVSLTDTLISIPG